VSNCIWNLKLLDLCVKSLFLSYLFPTLSLSFLYRGLILELRQNDDFFLFLKKILFLYFQLFLSKIQLQKTGLWLIFQLLLIRIRWLIFRFLCLKHLFFDFLILDSEILFLKLICFFRIRFKLLTLVIFFDWVLLINCVLKYVWVINRSEVCFRSQVFHWVFCFRDFELIHWFKNF